MKTILKVLFILLFPSQLIAQNPVLTSLSPAKMLTQSDPTIMSLTINGKNMWPDYLTISMAIEVMHIHFKRDGRDEVMRGSGISTTTQSLSFASPGWVDKPGKIEVYITIDDFPGQPTYRSNSLFLDVESTPSIAPVLNSLSTSNFMTGNPKEKYYIRLYGKNFGEIKTTSVNIGGITAGIGWANLTDGVIDVWIPSDVYTKAGVYPVLVQTKYGNSNPLNLKIEASKMMIKNIGTTIKPVTTQPAVQPKVNNNAIVSPRLSTLNVDNAGRLGTTMIRGARVTMIGVITDPGVRASFENYILSLENVFVVDDQLALADSPGNINVNIKAISIDKASVEKIRKQIEDKAKAMNLGVSVVVE
jgi:hypothetical protein